MTVMLSIPAALWGQTPMPKDPSAATRAQEAGEKAQAAGEKAQAAGEKAKTAGDQMASAKAGQVTVTGCLESATTPGKYKLTHAMKDSSKEMAAPAQSNAEVQAKAQAQANASAKTAASAVSYELVGKESELKPHVGHKIEVAGSVSTEDMARLDKMQQDQLKGKTASAAGQSAQDKDKKASDPAMQTAKNMSDPAMQPVKLNVGSVKMVSATCP
jgi:hypothetical protein